MKGTPSIDMAQRRTQTPSRSQALSENWKHQKKQFHTASTFMIFHVGLFVQHSPLHRAWLPGYHAGANVLAHVVVQTPRNTTSSSLILLQTPYYSVLKHSLPRDTIKNSLKLLECSEPSETRWLPRHLGPAGLQTLGHSDVVLKLTTGVRKSALLATEAENLTQVAAAHPTIRDDQLLAFPIKVPDR